MSQELVVVIKSFLILITSFFVSIIINKLLIKQEQKKQVGQAINQYLNEEHKKKKYTPSLGGIGIISGIIFSSFININSYANSGFIIALLLYCLLFVVGFIDDYIKLCFQNYHGLSALIRFLLELCFSLLITIILLNKMHFEEKLWLNKDLFIPITGLGIIFFPLIITGSSNAVNLTDGLDGLASSLYIIAIMPFIIIGLLNKYYEIGFLLIGSFGATLGFIIFNLYPAKIFMGDSGSLALGGLLGIASIIIHSELLLCISGGLFIFETISVIVQVIYFKFTKKRFFLMAPFHHHLELKGIKEYRIVMIFYVLGFVLSFISLYIGVCL